MADAKTRSWRTTAHSIVDPIWRSGIIKRGQLYGKMSHYFGFQIHIGESDIEMCKKIIQYIKKVKILNEKDYQKKGDE